ncbi:uncharacterized protein LOC131459312 [Solea solea]|uniref:uncharacterized protein LOC131459312 n=1 Tax=Solea solea TaxID=90069 RepID=UPI002729B1A8|nr:uncharacterized protein LOC131459312 [Solea solea]XP_058484978.1 uncharacterized protein LOC131459312 [Solea solea]XP_058484988.1 uncharacterized protein LOC131459312 [Solea solea]XP_058484996.1 uncharacterized protein LOC131459312 [Solea solea]
MERGLILLSAVLMVSVVLGQAPTPLAQAEVTRDGCGENKTCFGKPAKCDPAVAQDPCGFASLERLSEEKKLLIQVRQYVASNANYVGVNLITEDKSLIIACAISSTGGFTHQVMSGDGIVTSNEVVTSARGSMIESVLRCEFRVDMTTVTSAVSLVMGTGTFTEDTPGVLTLQEMEDTVSLETPNIMSSGASSLSHTHALSVVLTFFTMVAMHSA